MLDLLLLALAVLGFYLAFKMLKSFVKLAINSICGLLLIVLLNFLGLGLTINIWTVLITAFGGIPAAILLAILHVLGMI